MSTLDQAIAIAVSAHSGQVDKGGQPYILHPLRVMLAQATDETRIIGVLHDVVEDTSIDLGSLESCGFSFDVIEALDALTRRKDETYAAFIQRINQNEVARLVKIADIMDNLSPDRPGAEHLHARYYLALHTLTRQEAAA